MKYIKDDKRQQQLLEKRLSKIAKETHVAVGILKDEPVTKDFSMVDLAMVHEYGSKNGHIPERSFMRSTCDAKKKKHADFMAKLQEKYIQGKLSMKQALSQLGEVVSKDIVQTINRGIDPKLADATLARKDSSKPLIDTGHLKGLIDHQVRGIK